MEDPGLLSGLVVCLVFMGFGVLLLLCTGNHQRRLGFQAALFLGAFALRFAVAVVIYQGGLIDVLKDEDASGWLRATTLHQTWVRQEIGLGDLPAILRNLFQEYHQGYTYLLATLFYFTGAPFRLVAAAVNCFFGALTVALAYRLAASLFSDRVAVRVGWWTCLFPSLVIWSAQTLKEPVIICLELAALYGAIQLKRSGFSCRHVILVTLATLFLVPFRFYAAYNSLVAVLLALAVPRRGKKLAFGAAVVILLLTLPALLLSGALDQHKAQLQSFDLQYVEDFRKHVAVDQGSGVETDVELRTTKGFGLALLIGAAHLLLAPFPWQMAGSSTRMLLVGPEMLVWWWLFFAGLLPGLWYVIRTRFNDVQPLLFFVVVLGLLYSSMLGNVGLAFRHRAQLLPVLLVFAAVGLEQRARRRLTPPRQRSVGSTEDRRDGPGTRSQGHLGTEPQPRREVRGGAGSV